MLAFALAVAGWCAAANVAAPPFSPIVSQVQASPKLAAAFKNAVDALPAALGQPDMGLRDLQTAKGPQGEARRLALALFAQPEVLMHHREELGEVLGAERLRRLEFAVETYYEHAVAHPGARAQLENLTSVIDLTSPLEVEDLQARLAKAFDGAAPKAAATAALPASLSRQALAPSRPAKKEAAPPAVEDVDLTIYEQGFMDEFVVRADGGGMRALKESLKPYVPAAIFYLLGGEDEEEPELDHAAVMRGAKPGPHGAN